MVKHVSDHCHLCDPELYVHYNLALQVQSEQKQEDPNQNIVLWFTLVI